MHRSKQLAMYLAGWPLRFDWPTANCCHFSGGWVHVVEGFNPMEGIPSTPNERAALRLVRQLGGSMVSVWRGFLKREPISPSLAWIGDVVLLPVGRWSASGICAGRTAAFVNAYGQIEHRPMIEASHAWRIGA